MFWPYVSCGVLLVIGLSKVIKDGLAQKGMFGSVLGRLFFAIPMGVFGTEHFSDTKNVARIVPSWMPLHTFWVYVVGSAVIAAALSMILEKHAGLAATLFGCLLLLFVGLIHVPNLVATHGARLFWVICLRDIAFSGGAFALAGRQLKRTAAEGGARLTGLWRFFVGIPAIVFGIEHFLHPKFTPGVPMEAITPAWIPGHIFWAYFTGAALIACGASLVVNREARLAATGLGIVSVLLAVFVYLPIIVANPSDVDSGLNNLVDSLAFSGAALVVADAVSGRTGREARA